MLEDMENIKYGNLEAAMYYCVNASELKIIRL